MADSFLYCTGNNLVKKSSEGMKVGTINIGADELLNKLKSNTVQIPWFKCDKNMRESLSFLTWTSYNATKDVQNIINDE